jgi:hypothetical protein
MIAMVNEEYKYPGLIAKYNIVRKSSPEPHRIIGT